MANSLVCALCLEALATLPGHTLTQARTRCCQEDICQACCQTLADLMLTSDSSRFTCANCSAQTTIELTDLKLKRRQAIQFYKQTVNKHYDTVKSATEARLEQIQANLVKLNDINDQLKTNLSDIMIQAAAGAASGTDRLTQITARVRDHHRSTAKKLELAGLEYKQLQDQTKAELKYLERLETSLSCVQVTEQTQALNLAELDYDLTLLEQKYLGVATPAVPRYQPLRLLNHKVVLDDIVDQFAALIKRQLGPRHRVVYPNLIGRLEDDYGLRDPYFMFMVELPGSDLNQMPREYLSCWTTGVTDGFVLVDQDNKVVYHCSGYPLAMSPNWLVTLVGDSYYNQTDQKWIQVDSLTDILTGDKVASTKILPNQVSHKYQPHAQIRDYGDSCDVLLYCDRLRNEAGVEGLTSLTMTFQNWAVNSHEGQLTAKLNYYRELPLDETVACFNADTVVIYKGTKNTRLYGQVDQFGNFSQILTMNKGTIYRSFQDGSLVTSKIVASNGAGKDWAATLWRPDGNIEVGAVSEVMLNQVYITPWGRIVKVNVDEDVEYVEDSDLDIDRDVIMDFY